MTAPPPFDSHEHEFRRFLQFARDPAAFRRAFEDLLAEISPRAASTAEWGTRESVGAAALLRRGGADGPALVIGSGFLGTAPALAVLGEEVVVADDDESRLEFVKLRAAAQNLNIRGIIINSPRLPFGDATFGSIMIPDAPAGLPMAGRIPWDALLAETRRVLKPGGDLVVLAANRFAYKRFTGLHGRFAKPGPAAFVRRALGNSHGEYSCRGWARTLRAAGYLDISGFATYVSHLDYHYICSLERQGWPRLEIGPRERANRLKVLGNAIGLFPWLTPSFAFTAVAPGANVNINKTGGGARAQGAMAFETITRLAADAGGIDARGARTEHLLATRGNAAIALAAGVVARVPLCAKETRLGSLHLKYSERLRTQWQQFPAPRAIGEVNHRGAQAFVEERLPGLNSAQLLLQHKTRIVTWEGLAGHLSKLVIAREALTPPLLEELLFSRARLAADRMRDARIAERIHALAKGAAAQLRGLRCPLVISHGDLRAKHVLVDAAGTVTGILDWGTAREPNLPLFDLLHFIIHDHKQQFESTLDEAAMRVVFGGEADEGAENAIRQYCAAIGLDAAARRACEWLYPLEVAATAFNNWDYDRPRWVEVNFNKFLERAAGAANP